MATNRAWSGATPAEAEDYERIQFRRKVRFTAAAVASAVAFIFVLSIFFGSFYTIHQTERGVLLRNGAFVEVQGPGFHVKMPWIDSIHRIDMTTHTKIYGLDPKTNKSSMEAYSADQQPANLRVSVTFHIVADKVKDLYDRFGGDFEAAVDRLITPPTYAYSKVVFGQYTAQRAITARGQLNSDVAKALTAAIAYDPVFSIDSVQVEDISFSGEYIKSVEQRMQAEVEVSRMEQNLRQEKIKADVALTQAQGRANSVLAEAEAKAKATRLNGDAEASAIQARGDALSKNPALVSLVQAERWNGALPTTMIPGAAVPMLALGK